MSEITRCDSCHGKKKLTGLGGMIKDCPACKGVGYVSVEPVKVECKSKPTAPPIGLKKKSN